MLKGKFSDLKERFRRGFGVRSVRGEAEWNRTSSSKNTNAFHDAVMVALSDT